MAQGAGIRGGRRWWKRCGVVLAFLVAGAVLTVMVAWACDVRAPLAKGRKYDWDERPDGLDRLLPPEWLTTKHGGDIDMLTRRVEGFGVTVCTRIVDEAEYGTSKIDFDHKMHVHRCGWPALAMTAVIYADFWPGPRDNRPANTASWRGGVPVPAWLPVHRSDPTFARPFNRAIAFMPLPMGFAVDTVFYAGVCAIPWGVLKLRGWRRRAKGLCIRCAYPVGGSPVCTECGAGVLPPHAAAA